MRSKNHGVNSGVKIKTARKTATDYDIIVLVDPDLFKIQRVEKGSPGFLNETRP
jgi:hypothetical protein